MYLKFYFVLYFSQAATLGYILQGGKNSPGAELPLGQCTKGFTCPEDLGPGLSAGMLPGYCGLLLPISLYFPSLSGLPAFEIYIYLFLFLSPPLMEAGDL